MNEKKLVKMKLLYGLEIVVDDNDSITSMILDRNSCNIKLEVKLSDYCTSISPKSINMQGTYDRSIITFIFDDNVNFTSDSFINMNILSSNFKFDLRELTNEELLDCIYRFVFNKILSSFNTAFEYELIIDDRRRYIEYFCKYAMSSTKMSLSFFKMNVLNRQEYSYAESCLLKLYNNEFSRFAEDFEIDLVIKDYDITKNVFNKFYNTHVLNMDNEFFKVFIENYCTLGNLPFICFYNFIAMFDSNDTINAIWDKFKSSAVEKIKKKMEELR